eukprot:TRINITY_DN34942_c0_g1_i1.p1 TRINITY_DN34942_c0_g1~~TRINITY_DN34942_c0_g1_i1.p1  ORF type:complete len:750 (+),score=190.85 TRINITY_DN34942_c0_g1_i1:96-2345(+)
MGAARSVHECSWLSWPSDDCKVEHASGSCSSSSSSRPSGDRLREKKKVRSWKGRCRQQQQPLSGWRRAFKWLCSTSIATKSALADDDMNEELEKARPDNFISPETVPFFDYDCEVAHTVPGATVDWRIIWMFVEETVVSQPKDPSFEIPLQFEGLTEDEEENDVARKALEECPFGVLYFRIVRFYREVADGRNAIKDLLPFASRVQKLLRRFPVYTMALTRWPIFHALMFFSKEHEQSPALFCDGVVGVVDWGELRRLGHLWMEMKRGMRDPEGINEIELTMAEMFFTIMRSPKNHQQAAQECTHGFYFLVANQVIAAANKDSHYMPPFNKIIDDVIADEAFVKLASCGWPIFYVLDLFSDLNKGIWFFGGGDRKYLRGYSDWNLRRDELSPLLPSELNFLSPLWRQAAEKMVEGLAWIPQEDFELQVQAGITVREQLDGPMREIVRSLTDAALAVGRASPAESGRRLAYVVLLYGAKWAIILKRMAARFKQLDIKYPLFAIVIGQEAQTVCNELAEDDSGKVGKVVCWSPETHSQVHRFTGIHGLLHLGIDIIYMDMDTFMLRDPTPAILTQAVDHDALFASHADADCINIGVFYIRANAKTAIWFSQFVAWYHDHPFEVDQRGLHVFLQLPAANLSIAYTPEDLVAVRGGVLDDVNAVVIGDIGWHGDLRKMLIFHWCHRPIHLKEQELNMAYDAGDMAHEHELSLVVAMESVRFARPDSSWTKVQEFKGVIESYRKEAPPEREACW